jgi:urease accessory protein UreE
MAKPIDKKYLAGLTFRSSKAKKVTGEDGTKVQHVPVERELTAEDVLDWKDTGAAVVIVTADGQKYTVEKKASTPEK